MVDIWRRILECLTLLVSWDFILLKRLDVSNSDWLPNMKVALLVFNDPSLPVIFIVVHWNDRTTNVEMTSTNEFVAFIATLVVIDTTSHLVMMDKCTPQLCFVVLVEDLLNDVPQLFLVQGSATKLETLLCQS